MITGRLISTLLQSTSTFSPNLTLHPGQIIRGQIMKQLPNGMAIIQIGYEKLVARMETELSAGNTAWLQVMQTGETTLLKVLPTRNRRSLSELCSNHGLEDSVENQNLINRLIKEDLPIIPKQIDQLNQLIQSGISLDSIILALKKGLPITYGIVGSLEQFFNGLIDPNGNGLIPDQLYSILLNLVSGHNGAVQPGAESALTLLMELVNIQSPLHSGEQIQNFLKLLDQLNIELSLLSEKTSEYKDKLERTIRFIKGQQLLLIPTETPVQQWLIHLPFGDLRQSFVQIESQKQTDGRIDPQNCRLIFCLEMENLGNLVVNISITGRAVSMDVQGDHPQVVSISQMYREELGDSIREIGFSLSSFRSRELTRSQKDKKPQDYAKPYKGVDFRI